MRQAALDQVYLREHIALKQRLHLALREFLDRAHDAGPLINAVIDQQVDMTPGGERGVECRVDGREIEQVETDRQRPATERLDGVCGLAQAAGQRFHLGVTRAVLEGLARLQRARRYHHVIALACQRERRRPPDTTARARDESHFRISHDRASATR